MKTKKILCVLLSLIMIIGAIPMMALSSFAAWDYEYRAISSTEIEITKYNGNNSYVTIPSSIDGKTVVSIGESAFANKENLKAVEIPSSVKMIGEYAFDCCYYLTTVTFNEGLIEICEGAFELCFSIENIKLPESLKAIDAGAFFCCDGLCFVTIPSGVEYIYDSAFGYSIDFETSTQNNIEFIRWSDFIVCGRKGTAAEAFANDNGFEFRLFPDVKYNEWFTNAVLFNLDNEYFRGYASGYFGPGDKIQRQDFVVVLSKIAGADLSAYEGQNGGFRDVPTNSYFSAAVAWAKDNHILSGYADGRFGVGDPMTREQACVILYNYCNGTVSGDASTVLAGYPDGANVSDWAKPAVAWAAQNSVVGGNGKLNPAGNANRAEIAQIIMNMTNNGLL